MQIESVTYHLVLGGKYMVFKKWFGYIVISIVLLGVFFQFIVYINSDYESKPSKSYISNEFQPFYDAFGGDVEYFDRGVSVVLYSYFADYESSRMDIFELAKENDWLYFAEVKRGRRNEVIFCKDSLAFKFYYFEGKIFYVVYWTAQTNLPESCRLTNEIEMEDGGK